MDIQKLIDDYLAKNPSLLRYVSEVQYVPQGQSWPTKTTHAFELVNKTGDRVTVACIVKQPYSVILDMLLRVL